MGKTWFNLTKKLNHITSVRPKTHPQSELLPELLVMLVTNMISDPVATSQFDGCDGGGKNKITMGDCECKFGETKSSTQVDIKCIPPAPIPDITNLFAFPLSEVKVTFKNIHMEN